MNKITRFTNLLLIIGLMAMMSSCKKETSPTTGWKYNDAKNGGFEVAPFEEQATGPGLVFIEGGTFVMGAMEEDVMKDWNNIPRRVSVASFYMDECEVANVDYLEYLYWLERVFVPQDLKVVYDNALPDENVWRDRLSYNEPDVEYYFRHPAYRHYPVVGVNWLQATNYAAWRTDRVNEQILVDRGYIEFAETPTAEGYFNTDAYLTYETYEAEGEKRLKYISSGEYRNVKMEDGILLPKYRLPTEAEWEYAAYGLIGNTLNERVLERKIYPWNGQQIRTEEKKYYGDIMTNNRRGRGDLMGVASALNDAGFKTKEVRSDWPNDYGLYQMAGNVSEWVMDVYRQASHDDVTEYNPFRGNYFETKKLLEDGTVAERDSVGRIPMVPVSDFKNDRRRNYRAADNRNYADGDWQSLQNMDDWKNAVKSSDASDATDIMYRKELNAAYSYSLVGDHARVYKGGSWRDISYFSAPASRRYLDEDEATDYIGFRCAMARVGSQTQGR
ncbi:MAG: SUMF1/EgtB/PvdO family nonheme iron enzyme [Bacteroidales bacterium]|nr:SUMF1/EgtB/PvdO family nonheme iron enzyme [Bacteroidales bacterium]